ncbi:MAG: hypothetical protein WBA46_03180 [Thermomicrobiales bacterium]
MATLDRTPAPRPTGRTLLLTYSGLTVVIALGVLLQALLAGQGLFNSMPGLIDMHGTLGSLLTLVTLIAAGVAVAARNQGLLTNGAVLRSIAVVVLTIVQLVIGWATKDDASAIAWHIPNGVLLMGLTTANMVLALFAPRPAER